MAELKIEQLLRAMVDNKASDLHIRTGVPPIYRINGALTKIFETRVDPGMMDSFLDDIMNRDQKLRFEQNKECDFAVGARDMGRFRVNVFRQRGTIAIVIRHIKAKIPAFEELHLPEIIRDMALTRRGLVLVTGTTGSGKSTTLASMLDYINQREAVNIITVEDPIEYEIPGVAQAEVDSADKVNFSKALKSLLRHDPDVVMIGEIRDSDSLDAAVKAALTGHLVLSTLHTNDAKSTVTRLVDMGLDPNLVPATLRLAVAQRLVRRLCPECRVKGARGWEPKGCVACGGRGYRGRIGLFELYAPETGLSTSLADDARAKVESGITSEAEILRVIGV